MPIPSSMYGHYERIPKWKEDFRGCFVDAETLRPPSSAFLCAKRLLQGADANIQLAALVSLISALASSVGHFPFLARRLARPIRCSSEPWPGKHAKICSLKGAGSC